MKLSAAFPLFSENIRYLYSSSYYQYGLGYCYTESGNLEYWDKVILCDRVFVHPLSKKLNKTKRGKTNV
jgi:hypothetical protein